MRSLLRAFICISSLAFAQSTSSTVTLLNGTIQGGRCSSTDVNYFFSIPFAQPPVGDLRLAAPVGYDTKYSGTLDATQQGPSCPQLGTLLVQTGAQSEDW